MTRRLVDVAQDVIVQIDDCETERGIIVTAIKEQDKDVLSLEKRLFARTIATDIIHPKTGEIICRRNQIVNRKLAKQISDAGDQLGICVKFDVDHACMHC